MLSLFTIWATAGIITALMIPRPNKPHPSTSSPPLPDLSTSPQPLDNYTSISLHNTTIAIDPQSPCRNSLISHSSFPSSLSVNATQCRLDCEYISAQRASMGDQLRCRGFNVYLVWIGQRNLGMQCRMFERRVEERSGRGNGDGDGGRLLGAGNSSWLGRERLVVSDSFVYWVTEDLGDEGRGMESRKENGMNVTAVTKTRLMKKPRNSSAFTLPLVVSTQVAAPTFKLKTESSLDLTTSILGRGATDIEATGESTSVSQQTSTLKTLTTKTSRTEIQYPSTAKKRSSLPRRTAGPDWRSRSSLPNARQHEEEENDQRDGL